MKQKVKHILFQTFKLHKVCFSENGTIAVQTRLREAIPQSEFWKRRKQLKNNAICLTRKTNLMLLIMQPKENSLTGMGSSH